MPNENYEEAFKYLSIYIGIDLNDAKQCSLLLRAIDYADISKYTPVPTSIEDRTYNEIFTTKAHCYFKRKMLPVEEWGTIKEIFNYEFQTVAILKRKLPYL